jgi:SAM-dependent methyltransferase
MSRLAEDYDAAVKVPVACPVCGRNDGERLLNRDRYGLPVSIDLCADCGTAYVNPMPTTEWMERFYRKDYWTLYPSAAEEGEDRSATRSEQILSAVLDTLPLDPAHCLDVGCGNGGMIRALIRRFPHSTVTATDASEAAVARCSTLARVIRTNWRDGGERLVEPAADFVTLIHVLEHVTDPGDFLSRLRRAMRPDGVLYVEVPDLGSREWSGIGFFHIAHLTYFTPESLDRLLRRAGFTPVAKIRGASAEWPWSTGILATNATAQSGPTQWNARQRKAHRSRVRRQLSGYPAWARPIGGMLGLLPEGARAIISRAARGLLFRG